MTTAWPSNDAIVALAEPLIKQFEGVRLQAYLCPAGIPTIGYGTTVYPNGKHVALGDTCNLAEAQTYLEAGMAAVLRYMEIDGSITRAPNPNQAAAFLSLAYNNGLGVHDGHTVDVADSSVFRLFNAGNDNEAAAHFTDWDKAHVNGVLTVLPGLQKRREAERDLFLRAA